jgi:hypothetical protein
MNFNPEKPALKKKLGLRDESLRGQAALSNAIARPLVLGKNNHA